MEPFKGILKDMKPKQPDGDGFVSWRVIREKGAVDLVKCDGVRPNPFAGFYASAHDAIEGYRKRCQAEINKLTSQSEGKK